MSTTGTSAGDGDAGTAPSSPPALSRVQVYLYGVLSLFLGVVVVNVTRQSAADLLREQTLLVYALFGALFGAVVAFAAVYVVVRRVRRLSPETRYRLSRGHTLALTAVILGFLALVTVDPTLVAPVDESGLVRLAPSNLVAVLPLAAAVVTVTVLGYVRRRQRRETES